jgi:hypothetical protein
MLETAVKNVITAFLMLVGYIARFVGAEGFLSKLIDNLKGAAHAIAAPKEVGFKGIEQITKDVAAAAFTAGAGTQKSQTDLLADGIEKLEDIQRNGMTIEDLLKQILGKLGLPNREAVDKWAEDHPEVAGAGAGVMSALLAGPLSLLGG